MISRMAENNVEAKKMIGKIQNDLFLFVCILHLYSYIVGYRFGYRFFEGIRSIPRSIPIQYLIIDFPTYTPHIHTQAYAHAQMSISIHWLCGMFI